MQHLRVYLNKQNKKSIYYFGINIYVCFIARTVTSIKASSSFQRNACLDYLMM
jgi:hypothetical protein